MFCNVFSSFYYFLDFQWVPGIGKDNIISVVIIIVIILLLLGTIIANILQYCYYYYYYYYYLGFLHKTLK